MVLKIDKARMGTRSFIIIKIRKSTTENRRRKQRTGKTEKIKINLDSCLKQFCLMQYNRCDGYIEGIGKEILNFLRKVVEENRWEEFVEKCRKIKSNLNEERSDREWLEILQIERLFISILMVETDVEYAEFKTAYVKDNDKDMYKYVGREWGYQNTVDRDLFEKITHSPETLQKVVNSTKSNSSYTGSRILDMIMNNQVHKTIFCDKEWPSETDFCEYGYLIDCTTKEFLIYSTSRRSDESKAKDTDEEDDETVSTVNPLSFLNAIDLSGRFSIDNLPSDKVFFKKWDILYWQNKKLKQTTQIFFN